MCWIIHSISGGKNYTNLEKNWRNTRKYVWRTKGRWRDLTEVRKSTLGRDNLVQEGNFVLVLLGARSRVNRKWGRCVFVWGTGGQGGGTTALPGSFTASGRRGERGGGREFPRLLGDRSVNRRGIRVHARWRGRAFTRRRAPARHPSGIHDPDTHAAVGQDHSQSNQARACGLVRGRSFRVPHHERIVQGAAGNYYPYNQCVWIIF